MWRKSSAPSRACRTCDAVPGAVADYLAAQNLPSRLVMAPHPELRAIPWAARPLLRSARAAPRRPTPSACSMASPRIAETGTLMLPCAPERPTTLNLLPDTAIVVLRAARLVGAYEEAWDMLRAEVGGMPRNVMLVTGPRARRISSRRWNWARMGRAGCTWCWWRMRGSRAISRS